MKTRTDKFGLTVPVQFDSDNTLLNDHTAVLHWSQDLPVNDIGKTAQKVYYAILELNSAKLAAQTRYKILQVLHPVFEKIITHLRRYYSDRQIVVSQSNSKIINLAFTLQEQLLYSYKILLEETEHIDDEIFLESLHHILHLNRMMLFRYYQLYSRVPTSRWEEIHTVYQIAVHKKLTTSSIKHYEYFPKKYEHLKTIYTSICLFSALDPYSWRQNEQKIIFHNSVSWSNFVNIRQSLQQDQDMTHSFLIDLRHNTGPLRQHMSQDLPRSDCYLLETMPLVTKLENILTRFKDYSDDFHHQLKYLESEDFLLTRNMVKTAILKLCNTTQRDTTRTSTTATFDTNFKLENIHFFLNNMQLFNEKAETSGDVLSTSIESLPSYEVNEENSLETQEPESITEEIVLDENLKIPTYTCVMRDVTSDGCCLVVKGETISPAQSGNLVCFKNTSEPDDFLHWTLGTIQWMRSHEDTFEFGVKILAQRALAAGAQLITDHGISARRYKCILLQDSHKISSLIIQQGLFQDSGDLFLSYGNENASARATLTGLMNNTSCYQQFHFKMDISQSLSHHLKNKRKSCHAAYQTLFNKKNDTSFDDIWHQL